MYWRKKGAGYDFFQKIEPYSCAELCSIMKAIESCQQNDWGLRIDGCLDRHFVAMNLFHHANALSARLPSWEWIIGEDRQYFGPKYLELLARVDPEGLNCFAIEHGAWKPA